MGYLREFSPPFIREWIEGIAVILLTVFLVEATRSILLRFKKGGRHWELANRLSLYITNLGYVIGLRLFVNLAPLDPKAILWADNIAYVLSLVMMLILGQKAAVLAIEWNQERTQNLAASSPALHQGFIPLIRNLITVFVFLCGGIMLLKHFDYDVWSLVTALGVGSLAVGLAAKETLANMISGFMLIIDRNLRPGDRVNFKDSIGDVEEIGLRSTRIRTGDGNTMIVPNFDLVNTKILNLSEPSRSATCTTQIRVSFDSNFSEVKNLAFKILKNIPKIDQNRGQWVNLTSLSEGYQLISIGCWIKEMDDSGEVLSLFNQAFLKEASQHGIRLIEVSTLNPILAAQANPHS